MLTTPLLYYVGVIIFYILGANYLTFRIYNLMITVSLYLSIYILFKKLNISRIYSILYTSIIFYFFLKGTIIYGANYNILALAITVIGIIVSIDKYVNDKQIKHYNLIQGIITFLIIFTKQNIGLYYLVSNVLVELIVNKKGFIENILKQLYVIILLGSIYLVYLAFNNSLYAFIDYTILGMKEFIIKNKFVYINYFTVYILMFIYIAVFIIKSIKENNLLQTIKILTTYSITYLLIAFPILEAFHSLIAGIPLIITFVYCIHISFINALKLKQSFFIFILIFLGARSLYLMYSWNATCIKEKDSIFLGALYVKEEQEAIEKITNYIKNSKEKVVVLCPEAGIYNMPLGIDNGILDLPTQGNVGKNGAKKIIEILSNLEETKILMSREKIYWQEYDEVRKYVIENFEKIDEIDVKALKYNVYIFSKK